MVSFELVYDSIDPSRDVYMPLDPVTSFEISIIFGAIFTSALCDFNTKLLEISDLLIVLKSFLRNIYFT